jgi:hypothetical protein
MRWLALAAWLSLVTGACSAAGHDKVVDSWPIGPELQCLFGANNCDELTSVGLAGLDDRDPGHAPVASTSLHELGTLWDRRGHHVIIIWSGGPPDVLVVALTDGTTHAIGVGYQGISQTPDAVPWMRP